VPRSRWDLSEVVRKKGAVEAETPRVSIIVAAIRPGDDVQSVLSDLANCGPASGVEVLLAERATEAIPSEVSELPDGVVRVRVPQSTTLPRLLGTALQRARSDIIAITDTNCEMDDGWVSTLIRVHENEYPVIGGSVEPGALRGSVGWAAYLMDYSQFMAPLTEGIATELPGNNISMKRWALDRGRELAHAEFWKTHWCRQLQADGLHLRMAPQLTVRYHCALQSLAAPRPPVSSRALLRRDAATTAERN
jgi:hypothetical protein